MDIVQSFSYKYMCVYIKFYFNSNSFKKCLQIYNQLVCEYIVQIQGISIKYKEIPWYCIFEYLKEGGRYAWEGVDVGLRFTLEEVCVCGMMRWRERLWIKGNIYLIGGVLCINESLFPLTPSLSISILYSSTETFLPLSHSPKFPNPNPKLKPEFQVTKSHSFSTLSPFLRSGRNFGKGRRPAGVRRCSGGCSQRRLQPAATAASGSSCCCCCCSQLLRQQLLLLLLLQSAAAAAASGSSLLLLPARRGRRAAPAASGAGDDITRGEGVAFVSVLHSFQTEIPE